MKKSGMKTVMLQDFLTDQQIEKAVQLRTAKPICEQIIQPNLEDIEKKLGQKCDPMYLAYMCEFIFEQAIRQVQH